MSQAPALQGHTGFRKNRKRGARLQSHQEMGPPRNRSSPGYLSGVISLTHGHRAGRERQSCLIAGAKACTIALSFRKIRETNLPCVSLSYRLIRRLEIWPETRL